MKKIGYASWKGGTGKTLLAFNTVERATAAGLRTLGCDFDPQRTLVKQGNIRRASDRRPGLEIVEGDLTVSGIGTLEQLTDEDGYDLVVCDLPGADSFVMDRALDALDAILVPVSGAPYELINTAPMIDKTAEKGWRTYLVPNNLPPFQRRKADAAEAVGLMGTAVAPVQIVRRVTHWDAAADGMAANEYAPASPAAAEIREYWAWLQGAVDIAHGKPTRTAKELAYA